MRIASVVKRGADSIRSGGWRVRLRLGSIAEALRQDAQFCLGKRELEPIELFVQKADFVTVSDPERVELRPRPGHFVTAIAELTFELRQPRVQILELVFRMRSRRHQRAHTMNDIECWFRAIIPPRCLIPR